VGEWEVGVRSENRRCRGSCSSVQRRGRCNLQLSSGALLAQVPAAGIVSCPASMPYTCQLGLQAARCHLTTAEGHRDRLTPSIRTGPG